MHTNKQTNIHTYVQTDATNEIKNETRMWDVDTHTTIPLRSKEAEKDYRYMPEPDLPPLQITKQYISNLLQTLPELPHVKRERLIAQYNVSEFDSNVLINFDGAVEYFYQYMDILECNNDIYVCMHVCMYVCMYVLKKKI